MSPTKVQKLMPALFLVAALSAAALAACGGTPVPDLSGAAAVRIDDTWGGLSAAAPLESHYALGLEEAGFSGTAAFSVAGGEKTATAEVAVPADVMQAFLSKLAESPLKEGAYVPRIDRTDDYPWINIEVDLDSETVKFFSTSQGGSHVPWGASFGGKTYMIDSDAPYQALKLLQPYLKGEILNDLIGQLP